MVALDIKSKQDNSKLKLLHTIGFRIVKKNIELSEKTFKFLPFIYDKYFKNNDCESIGSWTCHTDIIINP